MRGVGATGQAAPGACGAGDRDSCQRGHWTELAQGCVGWGGIGWGAQEQIWGLRIFPSLPG